MIKVEDYNYHLPRNLIANKPASPRDSSRLFVYDTKTDQITFDRFSNLTQYLPEKSFLVMNDTRVLPARITLHKKNDAKVKVLFLVNEASGNYSTVRWIRGYVDRKVNIGDRLFFNKKYYIDAVNQQAGIFTFEFKFSRHQLFQLLEKSGTMPIPLYIKNSPLKKSQLRKKYQTVFARSSGSNSSGSAAAPTASLHFTNRLFSKLDKEGIKRVCLTLYVGLGTFAPISEKNISEKKLHNEFYTIPPATVHSINLHAGKAGRMNKDRSLVAVGTTVVRTLESFANSKHKTRTSKIDSTDLFILPPYDFKMVDCLITNFHLPKSSLMMLVEAFLQHKGARRKLVDLYQIAIDAGFRFYSFGDAMLVK